MKSSAVGRVTGLKINRIFVSKEKILGSLQLHHRLKLSLLNFYFFCCFSVQQRLASSKAHTSRFISANLPCNKFKNRLVNIMPYESTRVCLQPIRGVEGSDYINASFIDGYRYILLLPWQPKLLVFKCALVSQPEWISSQFKMFSFCIGQHSVPWYSFFVILDRSKRKQSWNL